MIVEHKLNVFLNLKISALMCTTDHIKINRCFLKIVVEFRSYLGFV